MYFLCYCFLRHLLLFNCLLIPLPALLLRPVSTSGAITKISKFVVQCAPISSCFINEYRGLETQILK